MRITIDKPQAIWELGKRDNQEDNIYPALGQATVQDRLFILCDGMGGHEHGEVASRIVCATMGQYISSHADLEAPVPDEVLIDALNAAYSELDKADSGGLRKMGTTLCLLLFHRGGLTAMHVGDSRIYHLRPSSPRIIYQSRDHSLVYDLYQSGEISYEEMRMSPRKNIITRALQPGEDNRIRPTIVHIADIHPGDYFYVCSDGMLELATNEELQRLFAAKTSPDEKRQQLIEATKDNKDNHSAYIIHITGVSLEEGDDQLADDEQTSRDNAINIVPPKLQDAVDGESDVDVVSEPANRPVQSRGKQKSQLLTIVVAAVIAIVVIVAFSLVRSGKNTSSEEQSPRQVERQRGIVRRPAKENINARKVKVKATKQKKEETKDEAKKQTDEAAKQEASGGEDAKAKTENDEPKTVDPQDVFSKPQPSAPQAPPQGGKEFQTHSF